MATVKEWLDITNARLDAQARDIRLQQDYYDGRHRSMFETSKYREEFGWLARQIRINFCVLVVDAERERLSIDGFRLGSDDDNAAAWRIWRANQLDARSDIAHTEALVTGAAYILLEPNAARQDRPRIRIEDAFTAYVAHDPEDVDLRTAGLKRIVDEDQHEVCWLYLADEVYRFRSRDKISGAGPVSTRSGEYWQLDPRYPVRNPLGVVPVIPLVNNPDTRNRGRSELDAVIPIQDLLNKEAADLIVASEFVAYPQRYATGIEVPVDPVSGVAVEPFRAGVNRLWMTEGEGVTFGQFPQASLQPYVSVIEMHTQQIATISKTPPHYLLGQSGNFPSGESLKATETGLVSKVKQAQRFFDAPWREAMVLAARLAGIAAADVDQAEVIWHDPENRVQAEVTDAAMKESALGVPQEMLWEKLGYTQIQIQRMKVMRLQETLERPPAPITISAGSTPQLPATAGPSSPTPATGPNGGQ